MPSEAIVEHKNWGIKVEALNHPSDFMLLYRGVIHSKGKGVYFTFSQMALISKPKMLLDFMVAIQKKLFISRGNAELAFEAMWQFALNHECRPPSSFRLRRTEPLFILKK